MKKTVCFVILFLSFFGLLGSLACAGPILDGILEKGELVVGITGSQPPMNATTEEGEVIGLDADIARSLARGMGLDLRFSKMKFSELLPALMAGKVDIIVSGMTMSPERNSKVAFVGPYFVSGKGILIKFKSVNLLKKEGLNSENFRVTTLKGSTSQQVIEEQAPKSVLVLAESYDNAIQLLFDDKADALIADYPFCAYMVAKHPEQELMVGETKLTVEPLGIAMQEDALLMNAIENSLRTMTLSGELNAMKEKWLKSREGFDQLP